MVVPADRQLECTHFVGVTTKGHQAFLIAPHYAKTEFGVHGGIAFDYCPFCGLPVSQILGEDE